MNTVVGIVASSDGLASDPAQRQRAWSSPATAYRSVQPRDIPVDIEHDHQWCGRVVHLERFRGALWCVAEVAAEPTIPVNVAGETVHVDTDLYFSVERTPFPDDIVLRSVALTHWPARVGARPVEWFAGGLDRRGAWLRNGRRFDGHLRDLVTRANDARHDHGRPGVVVHDADPPQLTRLARGGYIDEATGDHIPAATRGGPIAYDEAGRPRTMMVRPCGDILSVR